MIMKKLEILDNNIVKENFIIPKRVYKRALKVCLRCLVCCFFIVKTTLTNPITL